MKESTKGGSSLAVNGVRQWWTKDPEHATTGSYLIGTKSSSKCLSRSGAEFESRARGKVSRRTIPREDSCMRNGSITSVTECHFPFSGIPQWANEHWLSFGCSKPIVVSKDGSYHVNPSPLYKAKPLKPGYDIWSDPYAFRAPRRQVKQPLLQLPSTWKKSSKKSRLHRLRSTQVDFKWLQPDQVESSQVELSLKSTCWVVTWLWESWQHYPYITPPDHPEVPSSVDVGGCILLVRCRVCC
jgi:hypothetical protein